MREVRPGDGSRGVTLVEVMIAAILLLLLVGVVYGLFYSGLRSSGRGAVVLGALGDFNLVVERMRRDIRSCYMDALHPFESLAGGKGMRFHTVVGVTVEGRPVARKVEYRFVSDDDGGWLVRVEDEGGEPRARKFFDGRLKNFTVRLYDFGGEEISDSSQIPAYIECSFEHEAGERFNPHFYFYSRYSRGATDATDLERCWLPSYRVVSLPATFRIISDYTDSLVSVEASNVRIVGGVVVESGEMSNAPVR